MNIVWAKRKKAPKKISSKSYIIKKKLAESLAEETSASEDFLHIIAAAWGIVMLVLIMFSIVPIKETVKVSGFEWERNITIEEERTVKEDDWSVPAGGRIYDEQWELKEYRQVLDHYETVTETKSRQVIDHYETHTSYSDNGNGTFIENSYQTPVYSTEYYTETHQEPVYRSEPVYATKYYYEIERWFDTVNYDSSGKDKEAEWNTDYVLKKNKRDCKRSENYQILFDNDTKKSVSYDEWMNTNIGDGFLITKCRLGFQYSVKALENNKIAAQ